MVDTPVTETAMHRMSRAPRRSRTGPINGDVKAASTPPRGTAPESAVRDQPNSRVIGPTKMDSVATAGPCRAKPARHTQARMTQP